MIDVLIDNMWVVWLALILLFGVLELFTLDFLFLMLAGGSSAGLVATLVGAPWWLAIVIAAAAAVLLLLAVRPSLVRRLRRGEDPTPSNIDAIRGQRGVVVSAAPSGPQVRLANGETWTARPADAGTLSPGDDVLVVAVDGATIVVAPDGRSIT